MSHSPRAQGWGVAWGQGKPQALRGEAGPPPSGWVLRARQARPTPTFPIPVLSPDTPALLLPRLTEGAVRRLMLSPSESRLTRLRRCALLAPAVATAATTEAAGAGAAAALGSGCPGGLRLPFQQSLDMGHSPSSSGLVSR